VHRLELRPECAQLVEERGADEIASVEDQVGGAELRDARLGEPTPSAREMRVRDDGDAQR
jgi:hypothetical protein